MPPFVDAHHHIWNLERNYHPWLTDTPVRPIYGDYSGIRRSYLLQDFQSDWGGLRPLATVHVEGGAADPLAEARWVQSVADAQGPGGYPQAIIAGADFGSPDVGRLIEALPALRNVRGVRQLLAGRSDPWRPGGIGALASEQWRGRIGLLARPGFLFELQIYYQHMPAAAELARSHPGVTFIVNHCGTPARRDAEGLHGWRDGMRLLAACENVAVKLSGFGMVDRTWTAASIRPFVHEAVELFGSGRCMFGSNFPVDGIMKSYVDLWSEYAALAGEFSPDETSALLCRTAARYYRIELATASFAAQEALASTEYAKAAGSVAR